MTKTQVIAVTPFLIGAALIFLTFDSAWAKTTSGHSLYQKHCANCHHKERLGQTAPPLMPGLFSRSAKNRLGEIIRDGLPATAMPKFKRKLDNDQIELIVKYINTPVDKEKLTWTTKDIKNSKKDLIKYRKAKRKISDSDLPDVTLVMERGTKSLVVLEGVDLVESAKFKVGAVHGGPKFSYSLENVYSIARDGLVTKYNLPYLSTDYRLKAGISSRSIAVSHDDKTVAVANYLPANIVFLNDRLEPVHILELPGKAGGFYALPKIKSFVLSFRERPEIWLIKATAPFDVEKLTLPEPFEDFSISPVGNYMIGTKRGSGRQYIYDYVKKEIIAHLPTTGLPHLASASFWMSDGEQLVGVNNIKKPMATVISLKTNQIKAKIELPGAGFFVRTHSKTPYLWIDTETEKIALVDKNDFSKREYLISHKGKKAMHVEFTKNGERALVTIPGKDGEVVVYDSVSLQKIKTIPYNRPVGKYNAINKTYPERAMGKMNDASEATLGKKVFDDFCMGCHHQTIDAFGPSFADIAGMRSTEEIRAHITDPDKSAPKLGYKRNSMSKIQLTQKELSAIVAYIGKFN